MFSLTFPHVSSTLFFLERLCWLMRKIGPAPLSNLSLCIWKQLPGAPRPSQLKIEHSQGSQPFLPGPIFQALHHFLWLSFETSGRRAYILKRVSSQMEHVLLSSAVDCQLEPNNHIIYFIPDDSVNTTLGQWLLPQQPFSFWTAPGSWLFLGCKLANIRIP